MREFEWFRDCANLNGLSEIAWGKVMGNSYFGSATEAAEREEIAQREWKARLSDDRKKLAAKIVMALVDRIILDIIRPGPKPEERECYEMTGELRCHGANVGDAHEIDAENGVD